MMKVVFNALWPEESVPEDMSELADCLKGARHRIQAWKISACREGAREAWAMVKTRYTKVKTEHLAEVGPVGADGKDVPRSLVYDDVMATARFSQRDYSLKSLIDGLDEV